MCQTEFAGFESFTVQWHDPCANARLELHYSDCAVQWHCGLSANINPALSCDDLCDQTMSVQGQQCGYATLLLAEVSF